MHFNEKDKKERPRHGHPWSDKELADLRRLYPCRTNRALELHFGCSWNAILRKATQLGLKRPRNKTRRRKLWSDLEIKLLRELYPHTPVDEIADQLIGRSLAAVGGMAHILGLRRVNAWTDEETASLRRLWPDKTLSELAGIFKRSKRAVKSKARRLGLRRRPRGDGNFAGHDEVIAARQRKPKRPPRHPWSEEEVKFLKHAYRTRPLEQIAEDLSNRSRGSIESKAYELGLARKRAWTAEEDTQIRQYYLCLTWKELARRLDRSIAGVQRRAAALGLKRTPPRVWTDHEKEFLREHWSKLDAEELAKQLDRTVVAVLSRAHNLGLCGKRNWWTERDEAFLRKHWRDRSFSWIAQQLDHPVGTVQSYARKLGLRKQRHRPWTQHEIQILKSMHGHATAAKIALRLKRSIGSVNSQMGALGLTTPRPSKWTLQEKERLKTLYGHYPLKEIATQLGRSVCAVRIKSSESGLARRENALVSAAVDD